MNPQTIQTHKNAGATIPVHSIKACVIYEEVSGRIRHYHRVLTLVGGQEPTEQEIAEHALKGLTKRGKQTATINVLHIGPHAFEPGKKYRVDHEKQVLIPLGEQS